MTLQHRRENAKRAYKFFETKSGELWPNKLLKERRILWVLHTLHSHCFERRNICMDGEMITAVFGRKGTPSREIADDIMIRIGKYIEGVKPYEYKIDRNKLKQYKIDESISLQILYDEAVSKYHDELLSGDFQYKENTNDYRKHHPIQMIRRDVRNKLFTDYGYRYQADINNCHIVSLKKMALDLEYNLNLNHIDYYLTHKKQFRNDVCKQTGLEPFEVKKCILAVINGAKYRGFINILEDNNNYHILMNNNLFRNLKDELNKCRRILINNYNNKEIWKYFFMFEKEVRDKMEEELNILNIKYFLIHDGVYMKQDHDFYTVETFFKRRGFELEFDYKVT